MSKQNSSDDELARQIMRQLDVDSEHLPEPIQRRLDRARAKAMMSFHQPEKHQSKHQPKHQSPRQSPSQTRLWQGRWAFSALAALATVLLWTGFHPGEGQPVDADNMAQSESFSDWELVMSNQDYELLAHDLAFYEWLAQETLAEAI